MNAASLLFVSVLIVALGPIIVTWLVLKRWAWAGLKVTPKTAWGYIWKATFFATIAGAIATYGIGSYAGPVAVLFVGVVFAWRGSLLVDLLNLRRLLDAIRNGDRVALVARSERTITRLYRFRNFVGARLITAIAGLMLGAGARKEAEQLLTHVPVEHYIGVPFWHLLHTLALHRLKLGLHAEAEKALERCGMDAPTTDLEREHRYFRGLVESANGEPKRALKRMDADELPERDVVAAHAYAALGKDEKALAALERLKKEENGSDLLTQIAKGSGPAKKLASKLLGKEIDDDEHPYR